MAEADLLPSSDEELHAAFVALGVKLPLASDPEYPESIVDDDGDGYGYGSGDGYGYGDGDGSGETGDGYAYARP